MAIPTRTPTATPPDLELRAAFLLLHVDGRSSVQQIADLSGTPVDEVLAELLSLVALGLLELGGAPSPNPPPVSGVDRKMDR